jgi:hypothetical protein
MRDVSIFRTVRQNCIFKIKDELIRLKQVNKSKKKKKKKKKTLTQLAAPSAQEYGQVKL